MPSTSRTRAVAAAEIRRRLERLTPDPPEPTAAPAEFGDPSADPPAVPRFRLDAGRPGTALLCVVALLAAVLSAALTWAARPDPVAGPTVAAVAPAASTAGPGAPSSSGPSGTVVVAVVGLVARPGLVELPTGSRVADAVAAAGGALPEADLSAVNLARVLVDGEQVALGVPGAMVAPPPGPGGVSPQLINLNTATAADLEELPGVGPVLAQRIVDYRTDNGPFTSVDQLQEVSGIGPSTYADLQDAVTV